jgi:hypothetical protein
MRYFLLFHPIGGDPVAVVGIVVVHRPVCIHVANIVTVAGVGSPQPPVGRLHQHGVTFLQCLPHGNYSLFVCVNLYLSDLRQF